MKISKIIPFELGGIHYEAVELECELGFNRMTVEDANCEFGALTGVAYHQFCKDISVEYPTPVLPACLNDCVLVTGYYRPRHVNPTAYCRIGNLAPHWEEARFFGDWLWNSIHCQSKMVMIRRAAT